MSLSWLDRLTLLVHPRRCVFERRTWRDVITREQCVPAAGERGVADWQPALDAVQLLLDTQARRGGSLRILVADHFIRYARLPWSDTLCGPSQRKEMARALLKNAIGESANTLEIAIDRPAFGKSGIAAGTDRALLAGLRATARQHGLRLASIQPRLVAELGVQNRQAGNGWFASIDRDWLTLAGMHADEIRCLHNHRSSLTDSVRVSAELDGLMMAGDAATIAPTLFIALGDAPAPTSGDGRKLFSRPALLAGDKHA